MLRNSKHFLYYLKDENHFIFLKKLKFKLFILNIEKY